MAIVEMLNSTNIVLLVGQTDFGDFSPRKVTIWSTSTNSVICSSWPFTNKISIAKLNKTRMIVVENNNLSIYRIDDMKLLHTIEIGFISPGKLVMSPSAEKNNFISFSPGDDGVVKIYDLNYLTFKSSINAHKTQIQRLSINSRGDLLATCSVKGTIIRVFSIPKGDKLFTFKRGISSATIYSLNFSFESDKILVSSDTGTIHLFDLEEVETENLNLNSIGSNGNNLSNLKNNISTTLSSYMSNMFSNFTTKFIPKDYEDSLNVTRSILSYNNNLLKTPNVVSFNQKNNNVAFAFNSDGSFLLFTISYESKSISKINECNMKDLRPIV